MAASWMVSCALMSAAFAATPAGAGTAPVTPMAQETQALKVAQVALNRGKAAVKTCSYWNPTLS